MRAERSMCMAVLLVVGTLLVQGCRQGSDGPVALTEKAKCEDMVVLVRASGEIRAAESNKVYPQIKGGATIEFIVPQGDLVTNGQVVARFGTDEIEKQIRTLESRLIEQQNKLDGSITTLEVEKMDNVKHLKVAEQAVTAAEMKLKKYREGDAPLEKRKARLQVETTARELTMKKTRVKDIAGLLEEGFVTQDQVEEERIALERAKVAHETAKVEESLNERYTLPLRETQAVNALDSARTDLEKARKNGAVRLRQKEQNVNSARRSLDNTTEELADAREQLAACVVTAPTDGVVTYGDPSQSWRRSDIQVGARINRGRVLMTIPDMSGMKAVVNVSEGDIHRVAVGQEVVVRSEALPDLVMHGEVTKVAEVANSGGWLAADVKEFEVDILLNDSADLKPGFSCRTEIEAARVTHVLTLPLQAVFREGDELVVYRCVKSGAERVVVRAGETSDTRAQILEGIAEGDTVMLVAPEA